MPGDDIDQSGSGDIQSSWLREKLGTLLRDRRLMLKLGDETVADDASTDPSTLNRIENGKNDSKIGVIARIGNALTIAPHDLMAALENDVPLPDVPSSVSYSFPVPAVTMKDLLAFASLVRRDEVVAEQQIHHATSLLLPRLKSLPEGAGAGSETPTGFLSRLPMTIYHIEIRHPNLTDQDVLDLYYAGGVLMPADIFAFARARGSSSQAKRLRGPRAIPRLLELTRVDALKFRDAYTSSLDWEKDLGDRSTFLSMVWAAVLYQAAYEPRVAKDAWESRLPSAFALDEDGRVRYACRLLIGTARWLRALSPEAEWREWLSEFQLLIRTPPP